jgi:hypothetical protein
MLTLPPVLALITSLASFVGAQCSPGAKIRNNKELDMLEQAKHQLKRSDELRRGVLPSSVYEPGLTGGARFPRQLRRMRKDVALSIDEKYLLYEHDKRQVQCTRLPAACLVCSRQSIRSDCVELAHCDVVASSPHGLFTRCILRVVSPACRTCCRTSRSGGRTGKAPLSTPPALHSPSVTRHRRSPSPQRPVDPAPRCSHQPAA